MNSSTKETKLGLVLEVFTSIFLILYQYFVPFTANWFFFKSFSWYPTLSKCCIVDPSINWIYPKISTSILRFDIMFKIYLFWLINNFIISQQCETVKQSLNLNVHSLMPFSSNWYFMWNKKMRNNFWINSNSLMFYCQI